MTAQYLNLNYPDIKKVYVVGTKALVKELELGNLICFGSEEDKDKSMNVGLFDDIKVDEDIKAVVMFLSCSQELYFLLF